MSKRIKLSFKNAIIWLICSSITLGLLGVPNWFHMAVYGAMAAFTGTLLGYNYGKKDKD